MDVQIPLSHEPSAGDTHKLETTTLPEEVVQCLENARFVRTPPLPRSYIYIDALPPPLPNIPANIFSFFFRLWFVLCEMSCTWPPAQATGPKSRS